MTLSEHDLAELLAQLNAAPLTEAPSRADTAPADTATVAVVLVGTVTAGEHGLPLWHALGGEPWVLV